MRSLTTLLILSLSAASCFGQNDQLQALKAYSFVAGISVFEMFSPSDDIRFYDLKTIVDGSYYDVSKKYNSSNLLRLEGEIQFSKMYVQAGFGMRTETINLEASNLQEVYHFSFSTSYNASIVRDIYVSENHTSLIGSVEVGTYFFNKDEPFRIGVGAGFDISKHLSPQVQRSEIFIEETRSMVNWPQTTTTTSSHSKGSHEWNSVIREFDMQAVIPKITLKASYRFYKKFSLSTQVQMRLLTLKSSDNKRTRLVELPVGLGLHYHF